MTIRHHAVLLAISVLLTFLAACNSTQPTATPAGPALSSLPAQGDPAAGAAIFQAGVLGSDLVACSACHAVEGAKLSGPSLKNIASVAGARVSGQTAEAYLFNAIVYPNAYIVEGYAAGLMPANYGLKLTPQQLRDLINYLLTLR
jgi:cytochrome c oxidase subunit 2